ncbi:cytochrome c [Desulfuromonas sp. AOP6]|uniref:c-type cytochrome n=1 Tax=Desulfuromonas sp. AOP6 TaxID=1566351 RepID=UPI0012814C4E|nr:cytochrome c [Desulfuromonas sp. AOP6]BCA80905.1 periplasmic monoheme cytochrome c [Desulfuromonas sp. AOP6]
MNKVMKAAAVLALVGFMATSAFAVTGGNPKKGKYLYKKNCKACHTEGAEGGNLTPLSKTMAQWDRFFERDKHSAKPEAFEGISEKDLLDIQQFLYDHAADGPQPQTCG